ncbi:putative glycosyl transferase [Calothrix sp. NIES-4101]|nr:putative glycosyl transferase [Calothrix sp. NIES-4101]
MNPKVSIIIPSYNHSKYIIQTLNSVCNQTYENLEIIVIDDGSSDDSAKLISEFSDPRLLFIQQNNQGAHATINRGLSMASGDYIAILNSDDLYMKNRIQTCLNIATNINKDSMITSYIEVVDSNGQALGIKEGYKNMFPYQPLYPEKTFITTDDPIKNLLMFNYIATTSNFFCHKSIIDKIGEFSPLRYVHDWDYFLRIAEYFPIHIINQPLLQYRVHQNNTISENKSRMILEICWTIARNHQNIVKSLTSNMESEQEQFDFFYQLFYSLEAFNCEKLLLTLIFMFNSSQSLSFAMDDMLDPQHPLHYQFSMEIENQVMQKENGKFKSSNTGNINDKFNLLVSLMKKLKIFKQGTNN